jgi:hypothetical protein
MRAPNISFLLGILLLCVSSIGGSKYRFCLLGILLLCVSSIGGFEYRFCLLGIAMCGFNWWHSWEVGNFYLLAPSQIVMAKELEGVSCYEIMWGKLGCLEKGL